MSFILFFSLSVLASFIGTGCIIVAHLFIVTGMYYWESFGKLKLEHVVFGKGQFQQDAAKLNTLDVNISVLIGLSLVCTFSLITKHWNDCWCVTIFVGNARGWPAIGTDGPDLQLHPNPLHWQGMYSASSRTDMGLMLDACIMCCIWISVCCKYALQVEHAASIWCRIKLDMWLSL